MRHVENDLNLGFLAREPVLELLRYGEQAFLQTARGRSRSPISVDMDSRLRGNDGDGCGVVNCCLSALTVVRPLPW